MSYLQPFATTCLVEKPIQTSFYVPPSLKEECEAIFEKQGLKFSEGITRLIQLLIDAPDDAKPIILGQAYGDAAKTLARNVLADDEITAEEIKRANVKFMRSAAKPKDKPPGKGGAS